MHEYLADFEENENDEAESLFLNYDINTVEKEVSKIDNEVYEVLLSKCNEVITENMSEEACSSDDTEFYDTPNKASLLKKK